MENEQGSRGTKRRRLNEGSSKVAIKSEQDDVMKVIIKVEDSDDAKSHLQEEEASEERENDEDMNDDEKDEEDDEWEDADSESDENPLSPEGPIRFFVHVDDAINGRKTFEVAKHPLWSCSEAFRGPMKGLMARTPTHLIVKTAHKTFARFREWLHEDGVGLYEDHRRPENDIDLLKLYDFAVDYSISKLRRDAMNCFLQRFEDDLIPGEDSLVYFIQMKLPLATPDMIDPLWRFMIHMVLYFMGKLSYDTWEKLTEHDNPFAHTLYDSFREHSKGVFFEGPVPVFPPPDPNLIWITRDAESARQCIQSHWCHWHVKEPDGPCHNIADGFEREDTCKKETMAQRETWKLMREVMREEWQKEERREEEKTGSRRAAI